MVLVAQCGPRVRRSWGFYQPVFFMTNLVTQAIAAKTIADALKSIRDARAALALLPHFAHAR
ncbi:hypothetical protein GCM10011495_25450 [Hymenobacter frigidus]|uniref:Uncharacterized protein n=1 Tax=Hymenobacter frigidus TaxID=1524095 RepID=A0ABQ2A9R3_9BACT|nr:hypothetical protein GCM10011495_25450 [Hymenobacter frigidus]